MSSKYIFDLVAKTNDSVASGGNLTGFGDTTSINDSGSIAFVGKFNTIQDLLVGNNSTIANLSSAFNGNSSFAAGVEINDNNQVLAIDRGGGGSRNRDRSFYEMFNHINLWV